jgi:hypothetical protein
MVCAMVTPASTSAVWNAAAPKGRHRRDQPHQRDRHELHGDARLNAVDQVLARVLVVGERTRRRDREDGQWAGAQIVEVPPIEREQLHHAGHAVLTERSRDDRLLRVRQAQIEAPGVGDEGLDIVGRKSGREVVDVLQAIAQSDVFDEVGRTRTAMLTSAVIEHGQAAGARHEVRAAGAQLRMRLPVAIEEREGTGRRSDGGPNPVGREEDPAIGAIGPEAVLEQSRAEALAGDPDTDHRQDAQGFVQHGLELRVVEYLQRRPQRSPPRTQAWIGKAQDSGEQIPEVRRVLV